MLTIENILALASAGYSREEINKLNTVEASPQTELQAAQTVPAAVQIAPQTVPQVVQTAPQNDVLEQVLQRLDTLAVTMSTQPEAPTTEDVLAQIINPKEVRK